MVLSLPLMLLLLPVVYLIGGIRKLFGKKHFTAINSASGTSEGDLRYNRPTVLFRLSAEDSGPQKSWLISLSKEFMKQVRSIDRKLQGRILDAISDIASAPCSPVGDTCKPLRGELEGAWRYRIGDYRLIYRPDEARQTVHLLAFGARGSIYEE
ncbi:MAG: type II toxin-antitoxin system RelE/ParE family toxin [Verrucomicrobiota bacterium]|nr:type II toxin-antitoxin system RelE/ParE family toxin [Verrucomicrobiota bacterium]